ncbi:MAG TPA: Yip1 family protein [Anaerolineae bacterium]|nr:Yip1 family protein [Anaerolineae bacterium]
MSALLLTLRDIVLLRTPAYEQFRDRKDAMRRGVLILLACFLLAGSAAFVIDFANSVRPINMEDADQFRNEFQRNMEQWQQFMPPQDPFMQEFMDQFLDNFESGFRIGVAIDSLDTPLPRGLARWFAALGSWLSSALGQMGAWLAYAIWVLLFAKLMGGNGGVDRFLGLTALFAVPNLLGIFSPIPCVGPFISFIGWLWGVAVYVKAVQVSQRLDTGKAILAALLPALIVAVLVMIVAFIGLLSIIAATSQS